MGHPFKSAPLWWDREFDASGNPIREDVRASAAAALNKVCDLVRKLLGDVEDAPQLLERSVDRVSKYLNNRKIAPHDSTGLLLLDVYRQTQRIAKRRRRIEFVGGTSELSKLLGAPDWTEDLERRIFLEELVDFLSPWTAGIVRLRLEGLVWEEIAEMLAQDPSSMRKSFWRDVRKAYLRMLSSPSRQNR